MPLEKIIVRISDDANARADALREDAAKKADEILNKAKVETDLLGKKKLDEARSKAHVEYERAYISKSLEIRKEILKKKRELLGLAFDEAFKYLLNFEDRRYRAIIENIILSQVDDKDAEISFSKGALSRLGKDFVEALNRKKHLNLKMSGHLDIEDPGFIVKKGKVLMDFTFSRGLKALKERLEFKVAKILFG
jgi:vacuolar-type H+-ATPase subunit E/Vma4